MHAAEARVSRAPLVTLSDGPPVACDPGLRAALRRSADELDLRQIDIASGAGHDAAFMSRICPSAHGVRALPQGQKPFAGGVG